MFIDVDTLDYSSLKTGGDVAWHGFSIDRIV